MKQLVSNVARSLVASRSRRPGPLPNAVDQLTPQWLSSVLPGQVESVAVTATDEGTTLRAVVSRR